MLISSHFFRAEKFRLRDFVPVLLLAMISPALAQTTPAPTPQTISIADPAALVPQAGPIKPLPLPPPPASSEQQVDLQLPHGTISEVLSAYELLTGKRIIRDSKLGNEELSILARQKVPKSEAIRLIEAALLLNGYSLVPVDAQTSKILGQAKSPRGEGVPLIASPEDLPTADQVVSYYMPLRFLSAQDAYGIFNRFVKINPSYGNIVPLANASALVITEKTPLIRTMIDLQRMIDKPPAQISRHLVILQRANATKVVEILDKMFGVKNDSPSSPSGNAAIPPPGGADVNGGGGAGPGLLMAEAVDAESLHFIADERTNRVIVVCKEELFPQISSVIADLDASVDMEKPLEYRLRYARAAEVLPVLAKLIAESKEDIEQASAAGNNQQKNSESLVQSGSGSSNNSSTSGLSQGVSGYGGSSSPGTTTGDTLRDPDEAPPPDCVIVGETRIISDSSSNSIVIIGPPESRDKAGHILEILDRKPLQIYLSTLIGELRLENGMDYGFNYVLKFNQLNGTSSGIGGTAGGVGSLVGGDLLPDPTKLITEAVLPALSGLTLYGTIAQSVDIFAHFLETTNRFKTISRPVLYTTNNKRAVIESGQQVPIAGQTLTQVTPGLNGSSISATINYIPVDLKLEVIPLINSNNEVTLVITQQNDTIQGNATVGGQTAPIINNQKITTTVTVPSGRTVVLGGLISDDHSNDKSGIPYISRIPVLGALFGTTSKSKDRKELIVMIQPVIVDNNDTLLKASDQEVQRPEIGPEVYQKSLQPTPTPIPIIDIRKRSDD